MLRFVHVLLSGILLFAVSAVGMSARAPLPTLQAPKTVPQQTPAKKKFAPRKTDLRKKIDSLTRVDSLKKSMARHAADSLLRIDSLRRTDSLLSLQARALADTAFRVRTSDSSGIADSLPRGKTSDLDTVVTYYARDTVMFSLSKKSMRLRGQAKAVFKEQKLEAEVIEFDFNASTMQANAAADTSGKFSGYPKFTDRGEEFVGEKLLFNFQTKRGTITLGETKVQDGYYFGSKVKRVNDNTLFIQNGCYTTCAQPHPHFYFGSPEMKVITNDRIFIDPLIVYVEDMPVFALPFGIYFENKSGRRSGIVIPSFFFSNIDGVTFQNLGYYFALSDYYDTEFSANIYSKTGFLLKNYTRYVYQKNLSGDFSLSFGHRRFSTDDEYLNNWKFDFSHKQTLTPQSNIVANLSFSSQDFNRTFLNDLASRLKQEISSYAMFSQSFDNGTSISTAFSRSQNIIDGTFSTRGTFSFNVPQLFPFKKLVASDNWIGDIAFNYSTGAQYNYAKNIDRKLVDTAKNLYDTTFAYRDSYSINQNPSISISPKLGYFSITPGISYRENWYFRRKTKTVNPVDSSLIETYEYSVLPYRDYRFDASLSISTRLYGVFSPNILGIKAMRHVFAPTLSYTYTPSYSSSTTSNIGTYKNLSTGDLVEYSRFDQDGGEASRPRDEQVLSFSVGNTFQAKIAQHDTLPDLNLDLFSFDVSSRYDINADSLKLKDILTNFRTPALTFLNINGSARFTVYDEALSINPNGTVGSPVRIKQTLFSAGKGLLGLTFFSLNFSTSFSSQGISLPTTGASDSSKAKDSLSGTVGERFLRRINYTEKQVDIFGDQTDGYSSFSIPWSVRLNLTFTYNEPFKHQISRRLDFMATIDFSLTQTWKMGTTLNYDFVSSTFISPTLNVTKDLDCFDLRFTWTPTGYSQGFYLRFGIKAPQLQDLKIEKRDLPGFR
ncbi:MAG: putative LPS assembly protein LptD [Candidatus Kapaibacterium sp.]